MASALRVRLQDYFLGRLYIWGLLIFERHIDIFVKETMLKAFPLSQKEKDERAAFDADEDKDRYTKENLPALLTDAQKLKQSALNDKSNALKSGISKSSPDFKQKLKALADAQSELKRLKNFQDQYTKLRKKRRQDFVQPRYVQECQSAVSPSMKSVTTADRQWDIITHVEIITGHLRDIFAPAIKCGPFEFRAKELLDKLRLASRGRTLRAHPELYERPREAEVLDFLGTMHKVLQLCECENGAREISRVVDEAQHLMEKAESVAPSSPDSLVVKLSLQDLQRYTLYVAICEFTERLQRLVGRFRFKESSVSIPGAESGAGWSNAWQRRVKDTKTLFNTIALARSALFHSDHDKWQRVDICSAVKTMGEVLHFLHPGPLVNSSAAPPAVKKGMCPSDWEHHLMLEPFKSQSPSHSVDVVVNLELSDGSMRIPITPEQNFVGREKKVEELEQVVGALVVSHVVMRKW